MTLNSCNIDPHPKRMLGIENASDEPMLRLDLPLLKNLFTKSKILNIVRMNVFDLQYGSRTD